MEIEEIENNNIETLNNFRNDNFSLQKFMDDMSLLGQQVQNKDLIKPSNFDYGQLAITNYLLWLILGELTVLNNTLET